MNNFSNPFSRRNFLAGASSLGALYAASKFGPLWVLAQSLPNDPRIAQQPVVDKGFALVRKIGNGVYATISDRTKGLQTRSNGGFIVGRDAALLMLARRQEGRSRRITRVPGLRLTLHEEKAVV